MATVSSPLSPGDEHNLTLVANVHPPEWVNPTPAGRYNLVVIGAGTAGLVAAAGAAGLGAKVALIERHLMGGDCLNTGCVPSKTLLRAARAAADLQRAPRFGITLASPPVVDFEAVMSRVRAVRASISAHDGAHRFRDEYGVDVYFGEASFVGPDAVQVGEATLRFQRALIATGARAAVPPVPGLAETPYFTFTERGSPRNNVQRRTTMSSLMVLCKLPSLNVQGIVS
ncbi:MAG: FAD-dependent oxidoreductase [Thermoanaerobaculum sp.]